MRPVVLDTSVVLPATLSPRGYRRRFWVLLAFGALAERRNLARLEADAWRREGGKAGSKRSASACAASASTGKPLLADATWLIADDRKHISTDPHGITEYELPGSERRVSAATFSRFLEHLTDIDLDHVDPSLLAVAFGPLT